MATREGKFLLTAEDRTARAFDSVDRRIRGVSSTVTRAGALLKGAIGTAPVTALMAAAKAAIAHADAIGDQAKVVGLTTKSYQELSYAAKQLDVDQQALDAALVKFRDRLGEARMGSKEAAKDFRLLGLDPKQFRSTDEAFAAVTQRLGAVGDEFARASLQSNLFGKSAGPQLTNFLSSSVDQVARLREEAHAMGAVFSDETIQKADEASNKLETLTTVVKVQLSTALVELGPVLTATGEGFVTLAKLIAAGVRELQSFADGVSETLAFGVQVDDEVMRRNETRRRKTEVKAFAESKEGGALKAQLEKDFGNLAGATVSGGKVIVGPWPGSGSASPPEDPEEARKRNEKLAEESQKLADQQSATAVDAEMAMIEGRTKEREAIEELLVAYSDEGEALTTLREDRAKIEKAMAEATGSTEKYEEALKNIEKAEAELVSKQNVTVFADQAARNIQGITASLIDAAMAGRHLGDVIVDSLRRIAAEMAAQAALEGLFGLLAGSGVPFLASVGQAGLKGIGVRAAGGPVAANDPYVVGEKGPELFVPRTAGHIVPNHKLAANGPAQQPFVFAPVYNINASGGTQAAQVMALQRVFQENNRMLKADLAEAKLRKF